MKNKGLLLDRDGVINVDHGYIGTYDRIEYKAGLFPFLRWAQGQGFRLAIVTNQSGVARGYYSREAYLDIETRMVQAFREEGITPPLTLACFTHPEGSVPDLAHDSFWRKPRAGMVLEAIATLDLDPARSALIGDKKSDMEAALSGGLARAFWIDGPAETGRAQVQSVKGFAEIQEELAIRAFA